MLLHATHADDGRLVLTDGRVTLREQLPDEAAQLAEGRPSALTWLDGVPGDGTVTAATMTVKAAVAGLYAPGWGLFAIQRSDDLVALGGIGFHGPPSDDGVAEIGYDLVPAARGGGWATDAARLISRWALSRPEVRTVLATTDPENAASQRVLARVGFTRVGDRDGLRAYELGGPSAA
ncbi:GNAT family N-acetyltransferase [Streptomyces sp. NBC_01537]|uniref:GNAT family N-acetyltransferase n=1 Tax=Streptomyces sp. NBC_01537 TaxID=2903896 RepID=UPI00386FDB2A